MTAEDRAAAPGPGGLPAGSAGPAATPPPGSTATLAIPERWVGAPHQPRITVYGTDGTRTELSSASLTNWAAKVAGLLVDELGAAPGDRIFLGTPPGWASAAIVLGAWWAGLAVTDMDDPDAVAAFLDEAADRTGAGRADEVFVVSRHPLGLPAAGLAAHERDFGTAARLQADRFVRRRPVPASTPAVITAAGTVSVGAAVTAAASSGTRLSTTAAWTMPDPLLALFAGALAADGSLVVLDPALPEAERSRLAALERTTASTGPD